MAKAAQAAASARLLLDSNDADGACNRAYYAMFAAARAALLVSGQGSNKTHRGVLNAFSEHLIKNGKLSKDTGRLLKLAETYRYVADYEGDSVTMDDARKMVDQAVRFIASVRGELMPTRRDRDS